MAYVFDPINNTLIDDEDKSLGNKLALNDDEFQKLLDIPGVFRASEAPQPPPRPDVQDIDAINRFMRDNPVEKAEGGRINQNTGTNIMTLNPLFPEKDPTDFDSFKPLDVPGMALPVGATLGGMRLKDIFFSKDEGDDKKNIIPSDDKMPTGNEPPEGPDFTELGLELLKETVKNREYGKEGFFENINKYSKEKHGGNLKRAIADLTDTSDNKQLNNVYTQIVNAANRKGFKFDTAGLGLESNILQSKVPVDLNTLTTTLRTDTGILDNRIKELKGLDLNKVYNKKELADIIGLKRAEDTSDKVQVRKDNFLMELLLDQGLEYKDIPGGKVGFTAKETINALKNYSKNKMLNYESRSYSGNLRKKSTDNFKLRAKVEGNDYMNLQSQINKSFTRTLLNEDLYLPNSVAEFGHNPVPIALTEKIKMLNNKELSQKIFNIQNQTWQGKEINYDTLMRTSGTLEKTLKGIDKFFNKKITKNNVKELNKLSKELDKYYNSVVEKGGEAVKELPFHKNVIGKLNLTVPNVGDKLTADNFNVDMSGVDKQFIIGNVDLINSNAFRYADLTKEEKEIFGQNIIDQKIEQLKEFYGPEGANFPQEIIDEFIEKLEFGTAEVMGMAEREGLGKISKASGGGVEITPLPRANFGNGGAAGADVDFATQLEYFLTNEDAELPQLSTYKETKNPIEVFNDIIDPRNYPYYADVLARSGVRIVEFGGRLLPATGKLISDTIQKGAFKVKKNTDSRYVQDYMDELPPSNIKGTGIFSEFLENITPTSLEKKVGLASLIEKEEQKQIDRGSTVGPKVFADTIGLGTEVGAPIFPGLKLLRAYAKNRNLPVNDVTKKILVKEIDEVLETQGMDRREFLQATGAGATVILAKMLGFGDEVAQTAKVVEKAAAAPTGVPPYFFDLVEIIKKKGLDVTKKEATQNLQNVYKYKGYEVYEDLATGQIRIEKSSSIRTDDDALQVLEYKPGQADETTKGKPADDYEEVTEVKYGDPTDMDVPIEEIEDGVDLDAILEFIKNEKVN